jgi:hypothetical protein
MHVCIDVDQRVTTMATKAGQHGASNLHSPRMHQLFSRCDPAQLLPSAHLRHLSRSDAVRAQASVDVGSVATLFSEFGHEGMMGR